MEEERPGSASPRTLIAVAVVTFGMLVSETLQAITLSLQVFSHNAFLVVSIAMLGLGCGGSLAAVLAARRQVDRPERVLYACALLFAASLAAASALASRTHSIEALILLGLVPYVPAGLLLAVLFSAWPRSVGRSYGADLAGSAAGCVGLAAILGASGSAGKVVLVASAAGFAAAALLGFSLSRGRGVAAAALAAGTLAMLPLDGALFPYRPSPLKHYGVMLQDPAIETALEWSRWGYLGRLDVVRPGAGIERFVHGQGARAALDRGGDFRFLFASGDNWSYAIRFRDGAHREEFRRQAVVSSPYVVVGARPDVLVIGMGGGVDVFTAVSHDARSVTAVDVNPTMIRAARGLGSSWWNGALHDPRVRFVEMDGRTFTDTTRERYDVITLTAVDTGAAVAHGGFVLSENYLYTTEAWARYLAVLKPGGVIFVLRPQPDLAKLAVTAAGALRRRGTPAPEDHFAVLGAEDWRGMLVFREPLPVATRTRLEDAVRQGLAGGATTYLPGMAGPQDGLPALFALMKVGGPELVAQVDPALRPTTDDWPFFYHREPTLARSMAGVVLARVLVVVTLAGAFLIAAPLVAASSSAARRVTGSGMRVAAPGRLTILGYFGGIGLGFMFVEIALIQKLALLLGDPVYSLTVTLFVLLLATGVGSVLCGRLAERGAQWLRFAPLGAAILVVLLAVALPWLLRQAAVRSAAGRVAWAALLLAPLGAVLGLAFPLGIRRVSQAGTALVPWAWAINAIASVVGAALAVALALTGGFSFVLALAGAAYVVAYLSLSVTPGGPGGA